MALHKSLLDLAELAPRCQSPETARGLLSEAVDLLRNAVEHREDDLELAAWYSRLVVDIVRSPGVHSPVRLTGAVARGDILPSMPVLWIGNDPQLEEILAFAGLSGHSAADTAATRVDAGLPLGPGGEEALLESALSERPAALQLVDGLPDRQSVLDVQHVLLSPIAAIARWAAPAPRPTPDRLAIGVERELLTTEEAESLTRSWQMGMSLELHRWFDGVNEHENTLADLPPLDRTAYGSACRTLSATFESIAAREKNSS